MSENKITKFDGTQYGFLSNFHPCKVVYKGIEYQHTEGAFQSQKTLDIPLREDIAKLSAYESKKACGRRGLKLKDGRYIKVDLRPDWEEIKDQVMYEVVKAKFEQNEDLKEKLLATGDAELIEGNYWHDNYWGVCECEKCRSEKKGENGNHLGKILMTIRESIRNKSIF